MGWYNSNSWGGGGWYWPKPSSGGLDSATAAWIAAVVAAGGTVSGTQQTRVNNLVVALKSASLFTRCKRLWLFGQENDAHQAAIDIANLATLTVHGCMTLSAGGYAGDGSTGYLDLGIAPNAFAQDSISLGAYDRTTASPSPNGVIFGVNNAVDFAPWFGNSFAIVDLNDGAFATNVTTTDSKGRWTMSRTSGGGTSLYLNGTSLGATTSSSNTPDTNNIYSFVGNNAGSPSGGSDWNADQLAAIWMFDGLDATDAATVDGIMSAYFTAWGL
jgi:hypothetical protein